MASCALCNQAGRGVIILNDGVCLACKAHQSDSDDPVKAEVAVLKGQGWSRERIERARTMPWVDFDDGENELSGIDVGDVDPETDAQQAQLTDW